MAEFEPKPPRTILEQAAIAVSTHGIDPDHIAGTNPNKTNAADWCVALAYAGQGNDIGFWGFWAKWAENDSARARLADALSRLACGQVSEKFVTRVSAVAAMEYCDGMLSDRAICRAGRFCRHRTWPRLESCYRMLTREAGKSEEVFSRSIRRFMY